MPTWLDPSSVPSSSDQSTQEGQGTSGAGGETRVGASCPAQQLYRTGDRGRFLPDGTIELLGRMDTQVLTSLRLDPA